jgi:hypothetical protein
LIIRGSPFAILRRGLGGLTIQVCDRHLAAGPPNHPDGRQTDTAGGAGDDCDLTLRTKELRQQLGSTVLAMKAPVG